MRRVLKPLWVLIALLFLFEVWLWEHLRAFVARLVAFVPWQWIKAQIASWVERLPPSATLLVFLIPILLLLPIKFLGLWLLARGSWLGACLTLALAKIVSMGVTAFIFDITRPKLLQLAWFRWLYEHVLAWLARAHALIDPIKHEVSEWLRAHVAPVKQRLAAMFQLMGGKGHGGLFERIRRIRRRMQQPAE